jgi:hypothetical protein
LEACEQAGTVRSIDGLSVTAVGSTLDQTSSDPIAAQAAMRAHLKASALRWVGN